jgi:hypothetical protein
VTLIHYITNHKEDLLLRKEFFSIAPCKTSVLYSEGERVMPKRKPVIGKPSWLDGILFPCVAGIPIALHSSSSDRGIRSGYLLVASSGCLNLVFAVVSDHFICKNKFPTERPSVSIDLMKSAQHDTCKQQLASFRKTPI